MSVTVNGHGALQCTGILSSMYSHLIIVPGIDYDFDQDRAITEDQWINE